MLYVRNAGQFIAARKDSPLIVGIGKNENFIASDIPAILKYTRDIYILEDKEIACVKRQRINLQYSGRKVKEIYFTWIGIYPRPKKADSSIS